MISPETFVRVWMECDSLRAVELRLAMTKKSISSRASRYRKMGVTLKYMSRKR